MIAIDSPTCGIGVCLPELRHRIRRKGNFLRCLTNRIFVQSKVRGDRPSHSVFLVAGLRSVAGERFFACTIRSLDGALRCLARVKPNRLHRHEWGCCDGDPCPKNRSLPAMRRLQLPTLNASTALQCFRHRITLRNRKTLLNCCVSLAHLAESEQTCPSMFAGLTTTEQEYEKVSCSAALRYSGWASASICHFL